MGTAKRQSLKPLSHNGYGGSLSPDQRSQRDSIFTSHERNKSLASMTVSGVDHTVEYVVGSCANAKLPQTEIML